MSSPEVSASTSTTPAGCTKGCASVCDDCQIQELTEGWDAETITAMTSAGEAVGNPEGALPAAAVETSAVETAATEPDAPAADAAAAPAAATTPASELDEHKAWLDTRIAEIATKLQATLKGFDPTPTLNQFGERLDNFEARLEAVVAHAGAGDDRESLRFIEAHIREIDQQFTHVHTQLTRLDALDGRMSQLWSRIQNDLPSSSQLDHIVEGALGRALAATNVLREKSPLGPAGDATTGQALQRIEEALGRLVERVEQIEETTARVATEQNDPRREEARIGLAYLDGARALGQPPSEAALRRARDLHANDYVPTPAREASAAPARAPEPQRGDRDPGLLAQLERTTPVRSAETLHDEMTRRELRASAMRAKRRAMAATGAKPNYDEPALPLELPAPQTARAERAAAAAVIAAAHAHAQEGGEPASARSKRVAVRGRWNRNLFLSIAMLGMGTVSYLAVDRIMGAPGTHGPAVVHSAAARAVEPAQTMRAQPASDVTLTPAALQPAEAETPGVAERAATLPATIATPSLRNAAARGEPAAEFEIAARYADGRGVSPDPKQAFVWYQRAAMHGYVPAQFRLASQYEHGTGTQKDLERAKLWYRRAAEKGHAKAMHNLAVLIAGSDAKADMAQAAEWFRGAAERNLADSQYNLAVLHEQGQGVPVNLAEAYKWYALAARSGDFEAARRMETVKKQLSKSELAAAEKAVATWMPQDVPAFAADTAAAEKPK